MAKIKSKRQRMAEYDAKYANIPRDYRERLEYLYNSLEINEQLEQRILQARQNYIDSTYYETIRIIFYEEPEFTPRPRARFINTTKAFSQVNGASGYIQVYSITGRDNKEYMRMYTKEHLSHLEQLICTPCDIEYKTYFPIPESFSKTDKFLAEIGVIRPINKPDFDNIEKSYSDMFSDNIWIDDVVVVDATIRKYYSILPRVEIDLKYSNQLYNYYQYKTMIGRKSFDKNTMSVKYFGG